MIRRPPRSTQSRSSAASDVYKRQAYNIAEVHQFSRNSVMEFKNICSDMVAPFFAPPCMYVCLLCVQCVRTSTTRRSATRSETTTSVALTRAGCWPTAPAAVSRVKTPLGQSTDSSPVFIQTQSLALASSQSWLPLLRPSTASTDPVSYTHLTLPTIYSV